MRARILALLLAALLPACGGTGSNAGTVSNPTAAFAVFPSPSQLGAGSGETEQPTKTASNLISMHGRFFKKSQNSKSISYHFSLHITIVSILSYNTIIYSIADLILNVNR